MIVCGIIAEYDPFHLGHLYQLTQARARTGADYVICVLSTAFTQRGAPALFSTRARARMALENGADVVLGLPVEFSVCDAEHFALGGVYALDSLGVVTHLSFGCETADLDALSAAASLLENEPEAYAILLKRELSQGLSHVAAQGRALSAFTGLDGDMLASPNNVLAICYLRMLRRFHSSIIPVPIARLGDYHGRGDAGFPSASQLRGALLDGAFQTVQAGVPSASFEMIRRAVLEGAICPPCALDQALLYQLSKMDAAALSSLPNIGEGLENRILKALPLSRSREELLVHLKTKRYPYARLSRLLTHALLGLQKDELPALPTHARLLGFRRSALSLLHEMRGAKIPIISKNAAEKPLLSLDARAEGLWALGAGQPCTFYQDSPIILS